MKEEDKNKKPDLSDFIRYHKRDMTYLQRNTFEKKLQKDPFAREAEEGFAEISPEQANSDLVSLEKKLKIRFYHNRRVIIYRLAASIAVLMVISTVFFLSDRKRSKYDRNEIALNQTPLEITQSKAITLPEVNASSEKLQTTRETGEKKRNDLYPARDSEKSEEKELLAAPGAKVQEKIDLAEQTLNETIVTGFTVSKSSKAASGLRLEVSENKAENEIPGYTPPSPVDGFKSFDKYVEENIRKPVSLNEVENAFVVLSFMLKSSGVIENFKVIKSQGQEYSDEAVRLIKEGPLWKPAEENGNKIDEEVRLTIVFK